MKLVLSTRGSLTALALLVACSSSNSSSDPLGNRGSAATLATASPASAGANATLVDSGAPVSSVDSSPDCTPETESVLQSVSTEAGLAIYYCTNGAWQPLPLEVPAEADAGSPPAGLTIPPGSCALIQVGVDDNHNSLLDLDEVDSSKTYCAAAVGSSDAGAPVSDAGSPAADGGAPVGSDAGSPVADAGAPPADAGTAVPDGGSTPVLGACLECARTRCTLLYDNALGSASTPENLSAVSSVLSCLVGADWALGGAIPASSCFFADPNQPQGGLLPCYCGSTPSGACLASGPVDHQEACGVQIEGASLCSPVSASCVAANGSNPSTPLGDVAQLLNCERVACQVECGFPAPIIEE